MTIEKKYWIAAVAVTALSFFTTWTVVLFGFTGTPWADFWDMYPWLLGGSIGFDDLWQPHNEHRIVLAKILFWLDFQIFSGMGLSLVIANLLLGLCLFGIQYHLVKSPISRLSPKSLALILGLAGLSASSLLQIENFAGQFQSQFLLAYLLPLVSIATYCSSKLKDLHLNVAISSVIAIISVGTMANGVLALLILGFLAFFRRELWAATLFIALGLGALSLYLLGLGVSGQDTSLLAPLSEDPWGLIFHFFSVLGSPVGLALSQTPLPSFVWQTSSAGFGALLFVGIAVSSVGAFMTRRLPRDTHAILGSLWFIVGSLALISLGRANFGLQQSLESRYTTPALIAITLTSGILLLSLKKKVTLRLLKFAMVTFGVFLVFANVAVLERQLSGNNFRQASAIAAVLQVPDSQRLELFNIPSQKVLMTAKELSVSTKTIYSKIREAIEERPSEEGKPSLPCVAKIDSIIPIPGSDYSRVVGSLDSVSGIGLGRYQIVSINLNPEFSSRTSLVATGMVQDGFGSVFDQDKYNGFEGYAKKGEVVLGALSDCVFSTVR